MTRVTLDGLVRRRDRVSVVDGVSLEIRPGELAFVLGPSGAGKTTLARVIAGLEPLDAGEIFFDERIIQSMPAAARRVGLVFQGDALWPRLTVAENVGYGLKVRKVPRKERKLRILEALTAHRLDSLANELPGRLTPLQKLRVALARAMILEPELLILDDPFSSLDPRDLPEFRDQVRRTQGETETTMLVLSSDPREAMAMADRLAILDLGRIVQVGTATEVYNRPADAFVARLLGQTNLIQGQVEMSDARGDLVVRTPLGRLIGQGGGNTLAPGSPVTLSIRPESLVVGSTIPQNANRFPATLERQIFLGEVRQLMLRGPADWPVTALALQSQSGQYREGQTLTVSVLPEQVIVLPGKYTVRE